MTAADATVGGSDLGRVLEGDLCIGCGACAVADPSVTIVLNPEKAMFEPSTTGGPIAASVCPAVEVDFARLQGLLFQDDEMTPHGVVAGVFLAQSTNRERNVRASSGGVIKELLISLLSRPDVDGVISLAHVAGIDFEPRLLTHPAEIDSLPGSIYHNLAQTKALELLREHDGRFVVVAIPCQLEGIYKYVFEHAPELRERMHTTVGLLCGWQYNHHALRAMARFKHFDYDAIEDISYRGSGPVGKLRITADGKEHKVGRRLDYSYQVAFDRSFNVPRCHLCIDHSNFLADIVVGDAWLPSTLFTRTGISLVICRRADTPAMLEELAGSGRIEVAPGSPGDIELSQTRRVVYGDFAYAYAEYLQEIGAPCPAMIGPNRAEARLIPRKKVARFHEQLQRKLKLQRERRYRTLYLRKCTVELGTYVGRYFRWFRNRVVPSSKATDAGATRNARKDIAGFS